MNLRVPPPLPRCYRQTDRRILVTFLSLAAFSVILVAVKYSRLTPAEKAQIAADAQAESDARKARDLAQRVDHAEITAQVLCEQRVSKLLKAPSTARFAFGSDVTRENHGAGKYRITSWVDSQNGFGAMLRTPFSCEVETADGENFTVRPHFGGSR
jgi:hypothetical protein